MTAVSTRFFLMVYRQSERESTELQSRDLGTEGASITKVW